jgi:hypothetical protein
MTGFREKRWFLAHCRVFLASKSGFSGSKLPFFSYEQGFCPECGVSILSDRGNSSVAAAGDGRTP